MNPFRYGKEGSGYQFYDRTENFDQLYRTLMEVVEKYDLEALGALASGVG